MIMELLHSNFELLNRVKLVEPFTSFDFKSVHFNLCNLLMISFLFYFITNGNPAQDLMNSFFKYIIIFY